MMSGCYAPGTLASWFRGFLQGEVWNKRVRVYAWIFWRTRPSRPESANNVAHVFIMSCTPGNVKK
jgi:hypothetical protein